MYIETLLNLPLPNRFTYLVDESMSVEVGMRVQVPFGRRKLTAYVVKKTEHIEKQSYEIRPIIRVIDKEPLFGQSEIELAQWMAKFYLCSGGEALSAMIPGGRREIESKALQIDDSVDRIIAEEELLEQQRGAIEAILGSEKEMHYLYEVTGSVKSEVFFHVASQIIEQGAQVIYLVPEITLTVQLAQQVKLRFKERVAVLHSALTPSQRLY